MLRRIALAVLLIAIAVFAWLWIGSLGLRD
jgi:hypothetical protein